MEAATLKMRMKAGDDAVQLRWQAQSSSLGVASRLVEIVPDMARFKQSSVATLRRCDFRSNSMAMAMA